MSIPRSNSRSSTLRRLGGYRTYTITASWITCGDELKYRKGLEDLGFAAGVMPPDIQPKPDRRVCSDKTLQGPFAARRHDYFRSATNDRHPPNAVMSSAPVIALGSATKPLTCEPSASAI